MWSSSWKLTVILKFVLAAFGFAGALHRLRHGVGEAGVLELDVALALLLEADADAMPHELVAEAATDAGDAELEPDLL